MWNNIISNARTRQVGEGMRPLEQTLIDKKFNGPLVGVIITHSSWKNIQLAGKD